MDRPFVANACALSAVIFGASALVVIRATVQDVGPLSLALIRFGPGALLLLLIVMLGARHLLLVDRRDRLFLVTLGGFFYAVFPMMVTTGLQFTEASRGSLLQSTLTLWSAWLARRSGGERLTSRQLAGILLAFMGVATVLSERGLNWGTSGLSLVGDGLMLASALIGAAYGVLAQRLLRRYSALTVTTTGMALGTLVLLPAALAEGLVPAVSRLDVQTAGLLAYLAVFGGVASFLLWTVALTRLSPTQVAVYNNLNPLVAAGLGASLLGEPLTVTFVVGLGAVLSGLLLVNWPVRRPRPAVHRAPALRPRHPTSSE